MTSEKHRHRQIFTPKLIGSEFLPRLVSIRVANLSLLLEESDPPCGRRVLHIDQRHSPNHTSPALVPGRGCGKHGPASRHAKLSVVSLLNQSHPYRGSRRRPPP